MVRHGFNVVSSPTLGGTPRVYWGYACPLLELAESLRAPSQRRPCVRVTAEHTRVCEQSLGSRARRGREPGRRPSLCPSRFINKQQQSKSLPGPQPGPAALPPSMAGVRGCVGACGAVMGRERRGKAVVRAGRRAAGLSRRGDAAARGGGAVAPSCAWGTPAAGHQREPAPTAALGGSGHGEKYTAPGEQGKPKQKQRGAAWHRCAKEMSKDPTGLTNGFHRVPLSVTRSSLC